MSVSSYSAFGEKCLWICFRIGFPYGKRDYSPPAKCVTSERKRIYNMFIIKRHFEIYIIDTLCATSQLRSDNFWVSYFSRETKIYMITTMNMHLLIELGIISINNSKVLNLG